MWESEWRFNVWEIGQCYSDTRLVARLRPPYFPNWLAQKKIAGNLFTLWLVPPATAFNDATWVQINGIFTPGFPYGFDVDPD